MNAKRSIATLTLAATLATAGLAGAAETPIVGEQAFVAGTAPITIPGTGVHAGEWMGARAQLVLREVVLEPGQQATVTLRATGGRRIRGAVTSPAPLVGVRVEDRRYVGKDRVTITVHRSSKAPAGEQAVTVYALTR